MERGAWSVGVGGKWSGEAGVGDAGRLDTVTALDLGKMTKKGRAMTRPHQADEVSGGTAREEDGKERAQREEMLRGVLRSLPPQQQPSRRGSGDEIKVPDGWVLDVAGDRLPNRVVACDSLALLRTSITR